MTLGPEQLQAIAAEWRRARIIHPIYQGIARHFALQVPACRELESPVDSANPEAVGAIQRWLGETDDLIEVHQLRLFLQSSSLSTEVALRVLIQHHLTKECRAGADRDKLDFLLVQYFAQCAPTELIHARPSFLDVAKVLEPAVGKAANQLPAWLKPLEEALIRMSRCTQMRELLQQRILAELRDIKMSADQGYFDTAALVAFARANFITRQTFLRLMQADWDAIRAGVRDLQKSGVSTINCERAKLSRAEPLKRVLEAAQQWKRPFQAEYSAGNTFVQLAELRAAVDAAVAPKKKPAAPATKASPATQRGAVPARAQVRPAVPVATTAQASAAGKKGASKPVATVPSTDVAAPKTANATPPASPKRQPPTATAQGSPNPTAVVRSPAASGIIVPKPPAKATSAPAPAPSAVTAVAKPQSASLPAAKAHAASASAAAAATSASHAATPAANSSPGSSHAGATAPTAPVKTPMPAPPSGARPAASPSQLEDSTALTQELGKLMRQLSDYLVADRERSRVMGATIVLGKSRLALSSWEVTAFVDGGQFAHVVQRAVAVRVMLFQALEQVKQGKVHAKLAGVLALAKVQAARMQEALAAMREAQNVEATVALSATAQRLSSMIAEAEQLAATS